MEILLFDMDDVLLASHGYHKALQFTVSGIGKSLGFSDIYITDEDILVFEAAGVNSEWDSSAICTALLLEKAWIAAPKRFLPVNLASPPMPPLGLEAPDFQTFFHILGEPERLHIRPLARAEEVLLEQNNHHNAFQYKHIQTLLRSARQIDKSLTFRTIQELVLGSQLFFETYHLTPRLNCESYLKRYDTPNLSLNECKALMTWLSHDHRRAVIITNRSSCGPTGSHGAPEAEIGRHLLGFDHIPFVALGELTWLSNQKHYEAQYFLKPSPVHVLSALRLALGDSPIEAVEEAARLVLNRQVSRSWEALSGAQVYIFEDTPAGLVSIEAAKNILENIHVMINVNLYGVADSPVKVASLEKRGAQVFASLVEALREAHIL